MHTCIRLTILLPLVFDWVSSVAKFRPESRNWISGIVSYLVHHIPDPFHLVVMSERPAHYHLSGEQQVTEMEWRTHRKRELSRLGLCKFSRMMRLQARERQQMDSVAYTDSAPDSWNKSRWKRGRATVYSSIFLRIPDNILYNILIFIFVKTKKQNISVCRMNVG